MSKAGFTGTRLAGLGRGMGLGKGGLNLGGAGGMGGLGPPDILSLMNTIGGVTGALGGGGGGDKKAQRLARKLGKESLKRKKFARRLAQSLFGMPGAGGVPNPFS